MNNKLNPMDEIELDLSELEDMILDKADSIDEYFYLRDLKQRKLFINTAIDQSSIIAVIRHIMQYNADDRDIPVEKESLSSSILPLRAVRSMPVLN